MLTVQDDDLAFAISENICNKYFSDYMRQDFENVTNVLKLIPVIIGRVDKDLLSFLETAGTEPFFATSWLITWFAHDIKELDGVARLFDVLLSSHVLFCLYLCTAVRYLFFRFFAICLICLTLDGTDAP